jgi:hypothetical protein
MRVRFPPGCFLGHAGDSPPTSMKPTIWLIPAAALGIATAIASLAFLPIGRPSAQYAPPVMPPPPRDQPPAVEAQPPAAPVTKIPDLQPDAPPPQQQLPPVVRNQPAPKPVTVNPEQRLYQQEISSLASSVDFKTKAAKELMAIGSLSSAERYLIEGKAQNAIRGCLLNQQQRGVPFYQGKATCAAAEPAP